MDVSKILIVGANGQLGAALRQFYPQATAVDSNELDITDTTAVMAFDWASYNTVINAAAYTNVDGAETTDGRLMSWSVNATGARNLAMATQTHNLTLVHISTDYVFDGSHNNHTESEAFTPVGVYGQSKAAADLVISLVPKHYILRTTWVIGDGKNFVRTMLGLGGRGIAPTVVNDQIGRLTFTTELVAIIDHLLASTPEYGAYNATNTGEPASWASITECVFEQAGYDLAVTGATTAEYFAGKEGVAPRPLNSTMDLDKLHGTGFVSTDWREALSDYIKKEQS